MKFFLRPEPTGVLKYHPGKTQGPVGVQHPSPDNIPHATVIAAATHNSSPVKESSLVHEAELTDKKTVDSDVQPADFLIVIRYNLITLRMVCENMGVLKQHA
ncbi:camp-regulated phospho protein/endosulfine conserved region-domain-containing protein [Gigaspora margarita]|uniref:Camp-regulated phospho protein/endosulfine conserved region-domain-containing protein n=1 Tax=Gigaspora margarita TaxID=4874 RepID=A0A8H3X215_GIGMA|nr:camp-regulated phospho protein/endosulfine conserved region-domain-containing protein [Gigaspora margarita]